MAEYRLHANIISRGKGQSAVAAAAYRSGEKLYDERYGKEQDYTRKSGVLHTEIVTPERTPEWMKDRAKLWNGVEAAERRKDSQLSREIQLSLPHELDLAQNRNMVLSFIQAHFVDHGMIADVAIHAPGPKGDDRNIHAHVMLTTRTLTDDGFGDKNRAWNKKDQLKEWRAAWAEHENFVFRELGMELRVDHRSYADQGIEKEPTQHLGPVANDMERNGKTSRIGDENRARQQRNAERAALAQEATQTTRDIVDAKGRQEEQANIQLANRQSRRFDDHIEMDRRHDRTKSLLEADIAKRDDGRRAQLEADQRRLEEQLKADGWRKLMRDFLGKSRRDRDELEAVQKSLEDVRMREAEERNALQAKQEQERQAFFAEQQRRDQFLAEKIEQDRQSAIDQVKTPGQGRSQPNPANDRVQPAWQRPQAPEQDNTSKNVQEFQKAAEGGAKSAKEAFDKKRAIEEHKAKILGKLQSDREEGKSRDGYDYE